MAHVKVDSDELAKIKHARTLARELSSAIQDLASMGITVEIETLVHQMLGEPPAPRIFLSLSVAVGKVEIE